MTKAEHERFKALRKTVANMIRAELDKDQCCKSYEGTWEVMASYPNFFEDETGIAPPDCYIIRLHCYVLGPSRHYTWRGETWGAALSACEKEIMGWMGVNLP